MTKDRGWLPRVWIWLRAEQGGATQYLALAMAAGFLLLLPIFLNFFSLHITRRVSQTGADAAALAAARSYADVLSGTNPDRYGYWFIGGCGQTKRRVAGDAVRSYVRSYVYSKGNNRGIGHGAADQGARSNNTDLTQFSSRVASPSGNGEPAFGVWVPAVATYAATKRASPISMSRIYGRSSADVSATASAETWLDEATDKWLPLRCGPKGERTRWLVKITYEWRKTRLIKDIR